MSADGTLRVIPGGPDWPDRFDNGRPRSTYRNAKVALTTMDATFRRDLFRERDMIAWAKLGAKEIEVTDDAHVKLRDAIIGKFSFDPKKDNVAEAVTALCLEGAFNPVADYLRSLRWDGEMRLETWLHVYLGAPDTPLARSIGQKMLIAAARRVFQPGCKFDTIVVLEGPQGAGKSSALKILAGEDEYFTDQDMLHLDAKGQQEALAGKWIVELGELAGLRRADAERVKAFASRTHDRARQAYARRSHDQARRCIIVGTTNGEEYLTDQTGNRRFWPVRVGAIDLHALDRDRGQLWAEAVAAADDPTESLVLPEALWGDAAIAQEARVETDPWEEQLRDAIGDRVLGDDGDYEERVATTTLLGTRLGIPAERQTSSAARRVATIMRRSGWTGPEKMRSGSNLFRGFRRRWVEK